jgi:hypothetical protein
MEGPLAENPLVKKLKLKPGQRALLLNPPPGYPETLRPAPERVEISERLDGQFDWIQIFVKNKAELDDLLPKVVQALKPDSLLWISYPKGSSKIQTDLTRDRGWDSVEQADLKCINLVSVDDTWSAFSLRPYKPGEPRQTFR